MNDDLRQLLLDNGASMVGFAKVSGLYSREASDEAGRENTDNEAVNIPEYPYGISIILAHTKNVIKNITNHPTMDYYDAYHRLNKELDDLALMCADYIKKQGYNAYPQTTGNEKEYGIFRTTMPHKTVAVMAGLGWIGKSALFITEEYGSAVRLSSVLTDAPINYNKSMITTKCGSCMLCTNACPAKAISGQLWSPELDRDDFFNAVACRNKAREIAAKTLNKEITLCGKCIEVCPYTKKYTWA